jgi:aconitate hydratase
MAIFDAAVKYRKENVPLIVLAGVEYGTGSSRDWAAKGTMLLGVKAVIAQSFERIHRSNLVGMGVLPIQFKEGEGTEKLGLTGREVFHIAGLGENIRPGGKLTVIAESEDGRSITFEGFARLDTQIEVDYYRNGGILHTVVRKMLVG